MSDRELPGALGHVLYCVASLAEDLADAGDHGAAAVVGEARAVLLARAGRHEEALRVPGAADGLPAHWREAAVRAATIAALLAEGQTAEAHAALERAAAAAKTAKLFERGPHAAVSDLAVALEDAGAAAVLPRLAERAGPGADQPVHALLARAAARRGDHEAARAIAMALDASVRGMALYDLIDLAAGAGRRADVRALAFPLADLGYAHKAAAACAAVGDHERAAACAARATSDWDRVMARAAVAGAAGRGGHAALFTALAAALLADADGLLDGHELLVDGARAVFGDAGAAAWIGEAPARHRDELRVALAVRLAEAGDLAGAKAALERVADEEQRDDATGHVEEIAARYADEAREAAALAHARAGRMREARVDFAAIAAGDARLRARLRAVELVGDGDVAGLLEEALASLPRLPNGKVEDALRLGAALGRAVATRTPAHDHAALTERLWGRYGEADGATIALTLAALAEIELAGLA